MFFDIALHSNGEVERWREREREMEREERDGEREMERERERKRENGRVGEEYNKIYYASSRNCADVHKLTHGVNMIDKTTKRDNQRVAHPTHLILEWRLVEKSMR